MRGQAKHNMMVERTRRSMDDVFENVGTEYRYERKGTVTFFDLFGWTGILCLAIEVETTLRRAVDNARKAQAVGVPRSSESGPRWPTYQNTAVGPVARST